MTIDQMIVVLQAYKDGKKIQYFDHEINEWTESDDLIWNFGRYSYRVKPEPMTIWVNVYGNDYCAYSSKERAMKLVDESACRVAVKFVEVIE